MVPEDQSEGAAPNIETCFLANCGSSSIRRPVLSAGFLRRAAVAQSFGGLRLDVTHGIQPGK